MSEVFILVLSDIKEPNLKKKSPVWPETDKTSIKKRFLKTFFFHFWSQTSVLFDIYSHIADII